MNTTNNETEYEYLETETPEGRARVAGLIALHDENIQTRLKVNSSIESAWSQSPPQWSIKKIRSSFERYDFRLKKPAAPKNDEGWNESTPQKGVEVEFFDEFTIRKGKYDGYFHWEDSEGEFYKIQKTKWRHIKKKLTFPAPPGGEEWHNPDNLTPEQVEVDKGYRLELKSENSDRSFPLVPLAGKVEAWNGKRWNYDYSYTGTANGLTYRTLEPLPKKPVMVPLEASDIKPGMVARKSDLDKSNWSLITSVGKTKVSLSGWLIYYEELQSEGWLISSDGVNWKKCEKIKE